MKKCLPTTTKVSKDAKECVQECTSEFISFITSEAAERCLHEKRSVTRADAGWIGRPEPETTMYNNLAEMLTGSFSKTINGEDILFAMTTLGFENYADTLKIYLAKYRDVSQVPRQHGRHLGELEADQYVHAWNNSTSGLRADASVRK
jgi:histone H3/H4